MRLYQVSLTLSLLTKLATVLLYAPALLLPAIVIAFFGAWLSSMYVKAQLSVKREMSNKKSPVIDVLSNAIAGLGK